MMKIQSHLTFESSPAKEVPNETDPPPGKEIAELLCQGVQAASLKVSEPVYQHESYGWAFEVEENGITEWCMLQRSDEWLLICEPTPTLWNRVKSLNGEPLHRKVVAALDQTTRRAGYSKIAWNHQGWAP